MTPTRSSALRVLHIEDHPTDAELLSLALLAEWPEASIQRIASEAELKRALLTGEWDLVLSDYSMPGFNGLRALDLVREQRSPPPFIFVSGTIGEVRAIEALKRGATDYVIKDRLTWLVPAVRRALEEAKKDQEREALEAQLRRAQRLESIGMLAGGIAHDLNNMLAPILMASGLLRQKLSDPELQRFIDMIATSAEHGRGLVKQVLAFAKGAEGERHLLQMPPLIREVANLLSETLPRSIALSVNAPKSLWPIVSDATQLNQVLMNLCVNARDAMPRGGQLSIEAANRELGVEELTGHPDAEPGPFVALTVEDTGTGIPPEVLERMFDPFFTTKASKGTGLGLSTVLGIVKGHRGFLTVETKVGRGTAFRLFFPATREKPVPVNGTRPVSVGGGQGETILVIDDERSLLELIRSLLEAYGYTTLLASDATTAIGLYRRHREHVRLVLSDVMMPGLQTAELLAALRVINPDVLVVLMTGSTDLAEAEGYGCHGCVAKPMNGETLVRAIQAALAASPIEVAS
jgi:signal transduction histidine kinase